MAQLVPDASNLGTVVGKESERDAVVMVVGTLEGAVVVMGGVPVDDMV
jgi:hypothetical protein